MRSSVLLWLFCRPPCAQPMRRPWHPIRTLVWDLTQLYPSDAAWEAEQKSIAAAATRAWRPIKGTLGKDAASLAKAMQAISDMRKRISRPRAPMPS